MSVHVKDLPDGAVEESATASGELLRKYGSTLNFQIYRLTPGAPTIQAYQGPRIADAQAPGGWVSGDETVASVRARLRDALGSRVRDGETVTFFFNGRKMQDAALFFADHFMLLPSFVQVMVHDEAEAIDDAIRAYLKK